MSKTTFKQWKLKDCIALPGKEIKIGDLISMKWNWNKPDLEGVRFYEVEDIHRGWYFLKTQEGVEYVNQLHPERQVLIVVNL